MAKHDVDPVLQQLVRAVNESGQAAVPVTISVHGAVLTGNLIAQSRYFSNLVEGNPLMSALEPSSGLLGKEYTKEAEAESDHYLHVRAAGIRGDGETAEGLWRISLGVSRRMGPARRRRQGCGGGPGAVRAPARHSVTVLIPGRQARSHRARLASVVSVSRPCPAGSPWPWS